MLHVMRLMRPVNPTHIRADERVQLERLRDELLGADGQPCPGVARSQVLRAPLPLDLTGDEQLLLEAYATKAAGWGWRWLPPGVAGSRGSSSSASAGGVPLLTHVPQLWGATLSGTDLKLYLHHLADTCGGGGLPAAVVRTLNSKACRGAIMFGDALEQAQVGVCVAWLGACLVGSGVWVWQRSAFGWNLWTW